MGNNPQLKFFYNRENLSFLIMLKMQTLGGVNLIGFIVSLDVGNHEIELDMLFPTNCLGVTLNILPPITVLQLQEPN